MSVKDIPAGAGELVGCEDSGGLTIARYGRRPWLFVVSDSSRVVVSCSGPSLTLPGGHLLGTLEDAVTVFEKVSVAPLQSGVVDGKQWYAFEVGDGVIKVSFRDGRAVGYSILSKQHWNNFIMPALLEIQRESMPPP
jgi:hypothetical protein